MAPLSFFFLGALLTASLGNPIEEPDCNQASCGEVWGLVNCECVPMKTLSPSGFFTQPMPSPMPVQLAGGNIKSEPTYEPEGITKPSSGAMLDTTRFKGVSSANRTNANYRPGR